MQVAVSDDEAVAARVARVLAEAADVSVDHDVVVLPELWPIGAFAVDLVAPSAELVDGPLCRELAQIAATAGTWVFGGSFPERVEQPDGSVRHYNTQVVFDPAGTRVGTYRKVHLFGFNGGETTVMSSGDHAPQVVTSPLGVTGLATCYDLRFPEMFRALIDAGASAFALPAGWPERRIAHWQVLCRARAIEDQAFVLACNESGTHAGVPMGGLSMVIDPLGEVLAEAGAGEQVLSVEVDPRRVAAWRAAFPALADRRL
jgi:predicted amidohydrolase